MAAFTGWQHKSRDDDDDDNHNHRTPDSDDEEGASRDDAFSHYNQYAQYMKSQQAKANGAGGSGSASGAAAAGAGAGAGAGAEGKRNGAGTPKGAPAVDISKLDAAGKKALAEKRKAEGNEYFRTGEYSTAIDLYTQCIQLCPEDATFYGNRAAAYLMDKKYQSALTDALKAIALDPKAEKSYNRAAKCYQAFGEFDKSREMLDRLIALTPAPNGAKADTEKLAAAQADAKKELRILDGLKFKVTKVNELLAAGSAAEALTECETLMGYCPEANAVRALLADALIGCRKYDQARALLNSLYAEEKTNIQVIVLRGIALLYTGNVANALKHFQESLRMDPDNRRGMAMFKRVKLMEQKKEAGNKAFTDGRAQEAIDLYTEALALDPINDHYNATLYNNRAAAFMKANNFSAAVADCSRCIDLAPENVKAHLRRAKCHGELNNWDEALRDFERAQKLDPQNDDIARDIRAAKLEQKKAKRKDYYKIMGVSKHAQLPDIKKAFRALSLKHHPDRVTDTEGKKKAEVVFKEITEAYECLSDPKRKQRYDSGQDIEDDEGYGHGHGPDMSNIVRMFFGGGMGGMGGRGGHPHGGFGGGGFGF